MRLIKVPENTLPVRYDDDPTRITVRQENYFWFTLEALLQAIISRLAGIEASKQEEFYDELMAQKGANEVRISRESDFDTLKMWIENFHPWPGKPKDISAFVRSIRDAEKVKPARTKPE